MEDIFKKIFGEDAVNINECVNQKISELIVKHKDYLEKENIDLNNSYVIIYNNDTGSLKAAINRTAFITPEINKEIDDILNKCASKYLYRL